MTLFELLERIEYLSLNQLTGYESLKKQASLKACNILPLGLDISFNLKNAKKFPEFENQAYQSPKEKFQSFLCWEIWKNQLQGFESVALQSTRNLAW